MREKCLHSRARRDMLDLAQKTKLASYLGGPSRARYWDATLHCVRSYPYYRESVLLCQKGADVNFSESLRVNLTVPSIRRDFFADKERAYVHAVRSRYKAQAMRLLN